MYVCMYSSLLNSTPLAIKKDPDIDLNICSDINMLKKYNVLKYVEFLQI